MLITLLHSKIHRATVTDAELHYDGSITIDGYLMDFVGLREYQQVQVYNITNGARFETYAILGEGHSGVIQVNGAAAHHARKGDKIIIAAYTTMTPEEAETWHPKKLFVDENNKPRADVPDILPV